MAKTATKYSVSIIAVKVGIYPHHTSEPGSGPAFSGVNSLIAGMTDELLTATAVTNLRIGEKLLNIAAQGILDIVVMNVIYRKPVVPRVLG